MWYKLSYIIATVFGTGLFPRASGTATSLVTTIAAWAAFEKGAPGEWMAIAAVVSFVVGLAIIDSAETHMCAKWGQRPRHTGGPVISDYQQTTIDEFHGQLVACLPVFFLPGLSVFETRIFFLLSFGLFRLFDIVKPWPVNYVEQRLKGSVWGIMLDDTVAGIMAAILILLFSWFNIHWPNFWFNN